MPFPCRADEGLGAGGIILWDEVRQIRRAGGTKKPNERSKEGIGNMRGKELGY